MTNFIRPLLILLTISTVCFATGCKKNSPSPGGGGNVPADVLRPATMKVYEGNIGTLAPVFKFEYDKDSLLVRFGEQGVNMRQILQGGVQFKLFYGDYEATTLYAYFGPGNSPLNFYDVKDQPRAVSIQQTIYNARLNQTTRPAIIEWNFAYNPNFQVSVEKTAASNGIQVNYSYDDKKNLAKMEFQSLLQVYNRTTVTGYDDKPSPFSAVKGYRWLSYPQTYNDQYVQAFSANNPAKMVTELWSTTKNAFHVAETTNFNYTYNEKGYPVKIVVSTSYTPETGQPGGGVKTYEFTYK
jgi:hypothetical protein